LAKTTQISDLFAFPNFRKVGKFAASIERPKPESASASVGCSPNVVYLLNYVLALHFQLYKRKN